jgi:hypothetical protein
LLQAAAAAGRIARAGAIGYPPIMTHDTSPQAPFILGWEEWVALPDLGLPAIKAKVDTGARTSALHAFLIEPFGTAGQPMVRFGIHPIPGRDDIEIYCSAQIIDRREVTSSNGEKEVRTVIASRVRIGERAWPIELTLTNRETMSYRMLLGRQAIREDIHVDPAASFRQPRLSYKLYRHLPKQPAIRRPLRIAVLTRKPAAASNRLLTAAAEARGHTLELIDVDGVTLAFGGEPGVLLGGIALPHYDAVLPRIAARIDRAGAAAVRQFELRGSWAVQPGDALDRLSSRPAVLQALLREGVPVVSGDIPLDDGPVPIPALRRQPRLVAVVVGGTTLALLERRRKRLRDVADRRLTEVRRLAERAAKVLKLALVRIEIARTPQGPAVAAVSALPSLSQVERVSGVQVADAVIALIEREVRSWVRRADAGPPALPTDEGDGV